jgi:hypothetical protein
VEINIPSGVVANFRRGCGSAELRFATQPDPTGAIRETVLTEVSQSTGMSPVSVPHAAGTWSATVVCLQLDRTIAEAMARMDVTSFIDVLCEFTPNVMFEAELVAHLIGRPAN